MVLKLLLIPLDKLCIPATQPNASNAITSEYSTRSCPTVSRKNFKNNRRTAIIVSPCREFGLA